MSKTNRAAALLGIVSAHRDAVLPENDNAAPVDCVPSFEHFLVLQANDRAIRLERRSSFVVNGARVVADNDC
jgi:hypothetical protein